MVRLSSACRFSDEPNNQSDDSHHDNYAYPYTGFENSGDNFARTENEYKQRK